MPLKKGFTKSSMDANFSQLKAEGVPPKQRVAIVLNTARAAAKKAGNTKALRALGPDPKRKKKG